MNECTKVTARAKRKCNRPCLFRSPSMHSIQLVYYHTTLVFRPELPFLHFVHLYAEIITPPQDTIVFLNRTANFTCETDGGDSTVFIINGMRYTDLSGKQKKELEHKQSYVNGSNTELFTLTIPARVEYNGTTVQCVTGDHERIPVVKSENATLMIQGIHIIQKHIPHILYTSESQ